MTFAESLVKAGKVHKRKAADFYPTPPEATAAIVDVLTARGSLLPNSHIIEPCCGNGAISKVLEARGHTVDSFDLREDSGFGQGGVNYLEHTTKQRADWIITNPPFNLAKEFIIKALDDADSVAMLLKATYYHADKRAQFFEDFPPSDIYACTWRLAFLKEERGGSPMMECAWFVWDKADAGLNAAPRYHTLRKPKLI